MQTPIRYQMHLGLGNAEKVRVLLKNVYGTLRKLNFTIIGETINSILQTFRLPRSTITFIWCGDVGLAKESECGNGTHFVSKIFLGYACELQTA